MEEFIKFTKPNCTNTLKRLCNSDEEAVQKLNLISIEKLKMNKEISLKMNTNPDYNVNSDSKGLSLFKVGMNVCIKIVFPKIKINKPMSIDNKHKYICTNRRENQKYEEHIEKKLRVIEEIIQKFKSEKIKTIRLITNIRKEIQDLSITIEFLSKNDNIFDNQEKLKKSIDTIKHECNGGGEKKKKLEEEWINKLRSLYLVTSMFIKKNDSIRRENDFNEKQLDLISKHKSKDELVKKLDEIKNKLKENQSEYKEIKAELFLHYLNILKEGKDSRKDGIIWIIKAIWGLGYDILFSYLPIFLDDKSISFIFKVFN